MGTTRIDKNTSAPKTARSTNSTKKTTAKPLEKTTVKALEMTAVERREPAPSLNYQTIAQRAYEIFIQRGRANGQDLEDWLRAERELNQRH